MAKTKWTMTKKSVERVIKSIDAHRWEQVAKLADRVRQDNVIPYCHDNNVRYAAGMGMWAFFTLLTDTVVPNEQLKPALHEILSIQVYKQDLGSYVKDYDPSEKPGVPHADQKEGRTP